MTSGETLDDHQNTIGDQNTSEYLVQKTKSHQPLVAIGGKKGGVGATSQYSSSAYRPNDDSTTVAMSPVVNSSRHNRMASHRGSNNNTGSIFFDTMGSTTQDAHRGGVANG